MNDFLILSILPTIACIFMIYADRKSCACVATGLGAFILVLAVQMLFVVPWSYCRTSWETAKIYKTIPFDELTLIELPNHSVEIWHNTNKLWTLNTIEEYFKKDKISHIEYRYQEVFGQDFDKNKIIYKE